jgi:methyl-accepting chemotaxis protein
MSKDAKYIESYLERLANGNCSFNLNADLLKKNNDTGKMARLIKIIAEKEQKRSDNLKRVAEGCFDIASLKAAGANDGDASLEIVKSMNNISSQLKSVVESLNSGDLEARLNEGSSKGGFKDITVSLNELLNNVIDPISDAENVIKAMTVNDFTVRANAAYSGVSKVLIDDINDLGIRFDQLTKTMERIADGDFSQEESFKKLGKRSENDKLLPSVIKIADSLRALTDETAYITNGCAAGNVATTRGNADKFVGGYKAVIDGVNHILDTTTESLSECISVITALSVNDFKVEFSREYKGDFATVSNAVNSVRKTLLFSQNLMQKIAQGDISDFEKVKGFGKLSEEDELTPALIGMMEAINCLIEDTGKMTSAAEKGNLLYRINTGNVKGEFKSILDSLNKAFDSMSGPIIEMSTVLEGLSNGDTHTKVTGSFKGVFDQLKNDVNEIIGHNRNLVDIISKILTEIANGNLNIEKVAPLDGDWNGVPIALNKIIDSLNLLMGNIYNTVDEVAAGANQVATGSQELSQGATEQASSVEQLTASIAEIASQTKLNAQNAAQASTLAKSMRESATSGNKEMGEMLTSMQEINESSRNISKIIKVIDDIAFQTNILALNAAVEAARAGQHGKGFAVVAEEVRNLAARSANAANDTTQLIEGSIKRVEKGTQIATNTAKTLGSIVSGVDKVAEIVENIAVASNEQATGITQVNQGLSQVSKVVQTNSATSEQSAAASEELSGQAGMLKSNVEKFKLRGDGVKHTAKVVEEAAVVKAAPSVEHHSINLNDNFGKY